MRLLLSHPEVATRDCGHCLQYLYNEYGEVETFGRDRQPYRRHQGCPPPCRTEKGCPKGTPEEPRGLTDQNLEAYFYHQECRAVLTFPDDPIVREHAAIIRAEEDAAERMERVRLAGLSAGVGVGHGG